MDLLFNLLLFLIAAVANFLSALAGGGAGLVQLPALIFLGLPFPLALATHKVASVALGVGATARHLKSSVLEWRYAVFILVTGLPGVVVGASVILELPERLAEILLGLLTVGLGLYSWFKKDLGQNYEPKHRDPAGFALGGLVLFLLGFVNGSLTSGSGLFVTLWQVRWFGLDYQRAVAYTLVLVGLFWNGTGAITLGMIGDIQWSWLPALILGSIVGGYAGAHAGITKGNKLIKRSFEVVTILVGLKLLWG